MRKWLLYLLIFSLFFGLAAFCLLYLTNPIKEGQVEGWLVGLFLVTTGAAIFFTCSLLLSTLLALNPDHKLPPLLVKGTFFYSGLLAIGVMGYLFLRIVGAFSLWQVGLWCIILLSCGWTIRWMGRSEQLPTPHGSTKPLGKPRLAPNKRRRVKY